jgi:alkanesulfonate monooxygenase SsuD/methylene tetrahydromethanopterin reductase-like flavin-dependent oxidoreductase (luciferase family)
LVEKLRQLEALGFDSYWKEDHSGLGYADCWTTLTAAAAATTRMRLGSFVSCIYYRSPSLLARMAADVDLLSNGRLVLGLGIGVPAERFDRLGIAGAPSVRERQEALAETIQVVYGLWGGSPFTYQGQHFQVKDAAVQPGPMQQPRVPLLIAGGGERGTLHQVAEYADMANFGPGPNTGRAYALEDIERKLETLRQQCESIGRPYDSIVRSHISLPLILAETPAAVEAKIEALPQRRRERVRAGAGVTGTPSAVLAHYRELAAVGITYFVPCLLPDDQEGLDLLTQEVMPALAPNP